ncbi:MAG: ABC transporter substrate-binding protein [Deltaproteobacteria bacterium]|nr:ABC transporter substrate-binding protein [Deltaproteobacteria bacterium]
MKAHRLYATVLALFILTLLSAAADLQARTYLAYISDSPTSTAAYWVAKDGGIYAKHGLDVELVFISGSTRGIQSLIAGDVAFVGATGTAVINGRLAGGDIAIISSLTNTLPYYIIGTPAIKSPEHLKGRSAGVHIPGTAADFALRLALKKVGLSYKDIKAVTAGGSAGRIAAVMTGQLDFTIVPEAEKIRGEQGGLKVIMDLARLNIPFQLTCTVTTRKLIRDNPDLARRMVRAMAETVRYYKTHKEDVIRIMQRYTRGQNRQVLEQVYASYSDFLIEDTYPTIEGLKNTLEIQAAWDPRAANAKAESFVDLRFVDELKKSGFIDQLYGRR